MHYFCSDGFDDTQSGDVGPVRSVASKFLLNLPEIVVLIFGIIVCHCEASGRNFCFLMFRFLFVHVSKVLFYFLAGCIDLRAKLTQRCSEMSLRFHFLHPLELLVAQGCRPLRTGLKNWDALIVV